MSQHMRDLVDNLPQQIQSVKQFLKITRCQYSPTYFSYHIPGSHTSNLSTFVECILLYVYVYNKYGYVYTFMNFMLCMHIYI